MAEDVATVNVEAAEVYVAGATAGEVT